MSDNDLGERLRALGLRVNHEALVASLTHVHKSRLGPTETLEQLADLEERSRAAVNLARRTRFACLGSFKTLDRFEWEHPEKIDRALVVGQESMPAFERRLRRYTRPDLLVLDELGYLPCDTRAADMLYNIVSRRHEQRSTIITTNLAFRRHRAVNSADHPRRSGARSDSAQRAVPGTTTERPNWQRRVEGWATALTEQAAPASGCHNPNTWIPSGTFARESVCR